MQSAMPNSAEKYAVSRPSPTSPAFVENQVEVSARYPSRELTAVMTLWTKESSMASSSRRAGAMRPSIRTGFSSEAFQSAGSRCMNSRLVEESQDQRVLWATSQSFSMRSGRRGSTNTVRTGFM